MSVDRRPTDRFSDTKSTALSAVKMQVAFVLANQKHLCVKDPRGTYLTKVRQIDAMLKAGEPLYDWQYSVAEEAYEKTMAGYGMPAADTHKDKRRRGLKYG